MTEDEYFRELKTLNSSIEEKYKNLDGKYEDLLEQALEEERELYKKKKIEGCIYKFEHEGHVYIGQTSTTFLVRYFRHKEAIASNKKLYKYLRTVENDSRYWTVLHAGIKDKDLLNWLEKYYIWRYDSTNDKGLNVGYGGDSEEEYQEFLKWKYIPDKDYKIKINLEHGYIIIKNNNVQEIKGDIPYPKVIEVLENLREIVLNIKTGEKDYDFVEVL